jgi:hypothetical protein
MKELVKLEPDNTCTAAYSVIFKEEHGQVKEITAEQGGIGQQWDNQLANGGEDQLANGGEDQPMNRGEDQQTNGGEDLNVMEMEKEGDDNFQVTTRVLRLIVLELSHNNLYELALHETQ